LPDFSLEDNLSLPSNALIAGVDEVGRGPLAGPVTAVALVFNRKKCCPKFISKIQDSKTLSQKSRHLLFEGILNVADFGVGWADSNEIDEKNILKATMLAMQRSVKALETKVSRKIDFALIDGNRVPKLNSPAQHVIKGDSRSTSIAAASIIAKCTRDSFMARLATCYPGYGWENNAGYGTRQHLDAIDSLGITDQHRKSFKPITDRLRAQSLVEREV